MLEKTARLPAAAPIQKSSSGDDAPLTIRRVDAIPVALPLKTPMKMAAETITAAQNLLVRIESADCTVGWGEAASAPTMTGDTQGGLVVMSAGETKAQMFDAIRSSRLTVVLYGGRR